MSEPIPRSMAEVMTNRRYRRGLEVRAEARVEVSVPVKFVIAGSDIEHEGVATNLGIGGMFVATTEPVPFGEKVTVFLHLTGLPERAALVATARWTKPHGMGLEFAPMGVRETHGIWRLMHPKAA